MYWLIGIGVIWVIAGLGLYWWGWVRYCKKHPYMRLGHNEGLNSLYGNAVRALYALWPITVTGFVLFLLVVRGCDLYFFLKDWYENRRL